MFYNVSFYWHVQYEFIIVELFYIWCYMCSQERLQMNLARDLYRTLHNIQWLEYLPTRPGNNISGRKAKVWATSVGMKKQYLFTIRWPSSTALQHHYDGVDCPLDSIILAFLDCAVCEMLYVFLIVLKVIHNVLTNYTGEIAIVITNCQLHRCGTFVFLFNQADYHSALFMISALRKDDLPDRSHLALWIINLKIVTMNTDHSCFWKVEMAILFKCKRRQLTTDAAPTN